MYRNEGRRSWTSIAIWLSAFTTVTLIAAWQFQWFPTSDADPTPVRPPAGFESHALSDAAGENSGLSAADSSGDPGPEDSAPLDLSRPEAVFAHQSEPVMQPPPPDFTDPDANPTAASSTGEIQLTADTSTTENPGSGVVTAEITSTDGMPSGQGQPPRLFQVDPQNPPRPFAAGNLPGSSQGHVVSAPPGTPTTNSVAGQGNEPRALVMAADNQPAELAPVAGELAEIDQLQEQGTPQADIAAHKRLSRLYWEHPEWREALSLRIRKTAATIYFSPQPHYMTAYEVQAGDQLAKIAKIYGVQWEYLAALNRTDPRRIRPGQKLKVIKGPFGAVVDLRRFELTIEHHGFVVKRYPIGIGADNSTPIGEFTVRNKLPNPTYYGPNGLVIDANDPVNPLGEHWIDIGDSYGIHGTIDDNSIGKAESRGCVRMLNKDVAEVFQFLGIGSKVIIRR